MARDTWQSAARGALRVSLARLEELAAGSDDVKQLLDVAKTVAEVVGTAEMLEREGSGDASGD